MKNERENIDELLQHNTSEQLAGVNWERLNAAISERLNQTDRRKTSVTRRRYVLRAAAGIAAVAAVVLIVMSIQPQKPAGVRISDGRTAAVQLVNSKGSASVQIQTASINSQVMVDIGRDRIQAKCYVKIIDKDRSLNENSTQATWIIISRPQRVYADNGAIRDMMDIMYLF